MGTSIFLSRPTPHEQGQKQFLSCIEDYLAKRGLDPRTIGHTDYGRDPMPHIRSVMMDCNGLLGIAFRRFHIRNGEDRPNNINPTSQDRGRIRNQWMTTPYVHLEAAMAYGLGLPVLLFIEAGVMQECVLETGVLVTHPPVFDTTAENGLDEFFASQQWSQLINTWEAEVREVSYNKGMPPRLYHR